MDKEDAIKEAFKRLEPHIDEITSHYRAEQDRYSRLLSKDHDTIGRLLKCHLILEHYLGEYLRHKLGVSNLDDARLNFFQKATLIPDDDVPPSLVKPGIIKLNSIRNRFAHKLDAVIDDNELGDINRPLSLARYDMNLNGAIDRLEAFTSLACTWLLVSPPHIEKIFEDAFSPALTALSRKRHS